MTPSSNPAGRPEARALERQAEYAVVNRSFPVGGRAEESDQVWIQSTRPRLRSLRWRT
jgi:hypothetical protein